jgi:multicomponent Na+:H+ antiporter subunit F
VNDFLLAATVALAVIIAIPLVRVVRGPTVYDRLVGANAVATQAIVLIALIGVLYGRIDMFIDIILAYAILGFLGSLVVAKYINAVRKDDHD